MSDIEAKKLDDIIKQLGQLQTVLGQIGSEVKTIRLQLQATEQMKLSPAQHQAPPKQP